MKGPKVLDETIPGVGQTQQDQPKGVTVEGMPTQGEIGRIGRVGEEQIAKAIGVLQKYKDGKKNLETRIVENEQWFKLQHWNLIEGTEKAGDPEPTSAWLLNSILNKHADAMDNFPEPIILPREKADEEDAKKLSSIIPVILEQNDYEETYSDMWWYKLKTGTGVTGVFWNNSKNNGLGDIEIRQIDLLNLFWEPGIKDIQKSGNVFNVELVDNDVLKSRYPYLEGVVGKSAIEVEKYIYDDDVDTTQKSSVVDWYYKVETEQGERLHYCKFVNSTIIYASENDPSYSERGYYDHAQYPFIFDVLFVEEGTPAGFGYIDIMRDPQMYVDKLNQVILKNAMMACNPRYFTKNNGGINEKEFADWTKSIVHVEGSLDDNVKAIDVPTLPSIYVNILQAKIEEIKETSGNRDFSQGGTTSGVTAASAIAALQEAGSKLSRDMIKSSYRAENRKNRLVIELIRQFYTEPRCFRITGENGSYEFSSYDNTNIAPQNQGTDFGIEMGERIPIFDIKIKSQKANPFSRIAQNELAKEFYSAGFFNPQLADQALICIEMMDFEGKEKIREKVAANGQLMQQLQQMQQQIQQLATIVDSQNGTTISQGIAGEQQAPGQAGQTASGTIQSNSLGQASKVSDNSRATQARKRVAASSSPA